jgi:hypothetical protein
MPFGFASSFQLVNMLGESENRKCNVLFSRLDLLKVSHFFMQFVVHHVMQFSYSISSMDKFILMLCLQYHSLNSRGKSQAFGFELLFENLSHLILVNVQQQ